jgi:arabinan endo-1,5-alpha-L-arabinosidase
MTPFNNPLPAGYASRANNVTNQPQPMKSNNRPLTGQWRLWRHLAGRIPGLLAITVIAASLMPSASRALEGQWGVHDPSRMIKLNGVYHVWGTGDQIYHMTSTDMVGWATAAPVFPTGTYPSWITNYTGTNFTGFFWAPDCVYVNGKYFLYYACSTWGSKRSAIGVATSTDLSNWTDQGMVIYSTDTSDFNAIDPCPVLDASGNLWLSYGSYNSGIKIMQCSPSTGKPVNSTRYSIASPGGRSWSDGENSCVIRNGNYYYLFYNRGGCCSGTDSTYYVVMGRATKISGPYYDKNGKKMTAAGSGTTVLSTSGRYIGPGSVGLFSENGVNSVTFHFYDGWNYGVPLLGITRLTFSSDWPVFSQDWIPNGTYRVTNPASGKVWDDWGCSGATGEAVALGDYWGGLCQNWNFTSVGDGYYKITCAQGGLAVDVWGCSPDNGATLGLWSYWGGNCQLWKAERCSDGTFIFSSANGNRVAEIPGGNATSGTQLVIWDYNGYWNQKWSVSAP